MSRLRLAAAVLALLTVGSCAAAAPSGSDSVPPAPEEGAREEEGGPLDRPYVYVVAGEDRSTFLPADTASILEVSGTAEVDVPTDRARITFAVETEGSSARAASADNARRMERAIAALRDAGVEGLEIETRGYRLEPRYRRPEPGGTREIEGYRAHNLIEVVVPDVDAVGRLVDAAVEAGANRVASLAFEASDTEEARLRALEEAVERARRQARAVAGAMGVELGPALQVRTGSSLPGPVTRFRAEAMAAQVPETPVEPGQQTVSATVTIQYRILP